MADYIPVALRLKLEQIDGQRCAYCLTTTANTGFAMTHDHIQPISKGGQTVFENLCLACSACNVFKGNQTDAIDPITQQQVSLFNPRQQQWLKHFAWSLDQVIIEGRTPIGRATVAALQMNRPIIVATRRRWVQVGWHPPKEMS